MTTTPLFYSFQNDEDYCPTCPPRPTTVQKEFIADVYNPFETKHRRRTSRAQFKLLESSFSENSKPSATMRRWLAQKLGMTPRSVQVWFQNRRAKAKGQMKNKYQPPAASPPPRPIQTPIENDTPALTWPPKDQWQEDQTTLDSFNMLMDQPDLMAWYSPMSSPLPCLLTPSDPQPHSSRSYSSSSFSSASTFPMSFDELTPLAKMPFQTNDYPFTHPGMLIDQHQSLFTHPLDTFL